MSDKNITFSTNFLEFIPYTATAISPLASNLALGNNFRNWPAFEEKKILNLFQSKTKFVPRNKRKRVCSM